ncbi:MAG: hypothetical protein HEEMFOPI_01584 [Holosporales bacterium]
MKKICGINFFIICLLCFSKTLMGVDAHNPLSGLQSSAVSVSTYREEIGKLPTLVQKDAIEFYEKMHEPLLQWATKTKDSYIKNWSSFFLYAIFQKEMSLTVDSPDHINIDTVLKSFFADNKNKKSVVSEKINAMFSAVTKKKIKNYGHVNTSVFYNHLDKDASFKKIKDDNAYAQFLLGFLQFIQGQQESDEHTISNGHFQLTMAAFGLCTTSLVVLKTLDIKQNKSLCSKIDEYLQILIKPMSADFIKRIIERKIFFDYEQSLFFTRLTEKNQKI